MTFIPLRYTKALPLSHFIAQTRLIGYQLINVSLTRTVIDIFLQPLSLSHVTNCLYTSGNMSAFHVENVPPHVSSVKDTSFWDSLQKAILNGTVLLQNTASAYNQYPSNSSKYKQLLHSKSRAHNYLRCYIHFSHMQQHKHLSSQFYPTIYELGFHFAKSLIPPQRATAAAGTSLACSCDWSQVLPRRAVSFMQLWKVLSSLHFWNWWTTSSAPTTSSTSSTTFIQWFEVVHRKEQVVVCCKIF